ncbi:MAG: ADP-ribosylglycohydrolase family protein [Patescibacteria group bacterium]
MKILEPEVVRDRIRGCLIGLAIGDALGAPFEILDHLEIAYGVNDPDGVTGFIRQPKGCSPEIRRRLRQRASGAITDDTQLSEATAVSLLRCGGYNREDQVRTFVEAYRTSSVGWGGTTIAAAKAFSDWLYGDPLEHDGRPGRRPLSDTPPPIEPGRSCGNGVAMKVAPLALYYALRQPNGVYEFYDDLKSFGLMTHGDPRAWIGAMGIGLTIIECLTRPQVRSDAELAWLFRTIIGNTDSQERHFAPSMPDDDRLAKRYAAVIPALSGAQLLRETAGTSCYTLESVPFAVGTFMRHANDYRTAVLEAVNAGGDTDTNAAMVGAMVGANVGESGIPKAWIQTVPSTERMRALADKMFNRFWYGHGNKI